MINGIEQLAITKLDVLDTFDEVQVCVGYEYKGKRLKTFPSDLASLERISPVYEKFDGWKTSLSEVRTYANLPAQARIFVESLSRLSGIPIWLLSVGPERDQTIICS